jgi:hypothetical protein
MPALYAVNQDVETSPRRVQHENARDEQRRGRQLNPPGGLSCWHPCATDRSQHRRVSLHRMCRPTLASFIPVLVTANSWLNLRGHANRGNGSTPHVRQSSFVSGSSLSSARAFSPGRIVLRHQSEEPMAVRRGNQVNHFVDDHVLEQVFRFLHEFRVEANVPSTMIAATPLGLHALQEVTGHRYPEARLPFADKSGTAACSSDLCHACTIASRPAPLD